MRIPRVMLIDGDAFFRRHGNFIGMALRQRGDQLGPVAFLDRIQIGPVFFRTRHLQILIARCIQFLRHRFGQMIARRSMTSLVIQYAEHMRALNMLSCNHHIGRAFGGDGDFRSILGKDRNDLSNLRVFDNGVDQRLLLRHLRQRGQLRTVIKVVLYSSAVQTTAERGMT